MSDTQLEAVTKAQPLFLEQNLKTTNGAVIAVQHEHGQGGELARPVPAIAAVHHNRGFPRLHLVCDPQRSCENQLQRKKNDNLIQGSVNCRDPLFHLDVLKPVSGLQIGEPVGILNVGIDHVL